MCGITVVVAVFASVCMCYPVVVVKRGKGSIWSLLVGGGDYVAVCVCVCLRRRSEFNV